MTDNPHKGSPLRSAFTDEEWEEVEALCVKKVFPWCVYMLENKDKTRLYTGITNDLRARLQKHNTGKGAKATKPGGPWKVVWLERVSSKSAALRFEYQIKRLSRNAKLEMARGPSLLR